jgi:hypothetical protein
MSANNKRGSDAFSNDSHVDEIGNKRAKTHSESSAEDQVPVVTRPLVWSYTRGALGDATDYLRSHEGGNYHRDGVTMGLMLNGGGSIRDNINGTVIITNV